MKDKEKHLKHLSRQRERFFDADAFKRFYRDNTDSEVIADFEDDIFHGVIDASEKEYADALHCVESVMTLAGTISASGLLERHARVTVKQGICHHLANEDKLEWKS